MYVIRGVCAYSNGPTLGGGAGSLQSQGGPMDAETGDLRSFADAILAPREQR